MSNLTDRRKFKRRNDWYQEASQRWWKELAPALIFAAIGIGVTALAMIKGIPIGEYEFWNH
jgi:hypothetical protein